MADITLDPVKYEVFFNKLDQSLNEAQDVIRILSGSSIVKEGGEALEAFYLPTGEAVNIATGILMHFMNITRTIRYMNENRYDAEDIGIYDGDQFMNNDAYIGGMHVPDTGVVAPFFYDGELLGYLAGISHTTETGGVEPGGMCPSATEAWHDGIHVPIVKIVEKGKARRDVWQLLLRSTRDPRTFELDLRARIAGNQRARKRITDLVEEFGVEFFKKACKQLVKDGEAFFRAKLKRMRPGIYSARMFSDTLGGIQPPKLAVVQVDMEITEEGFLKLNIPVVSPQQPCYNNAYLPAVEASLCYCLLTQVVYDGRWNSGMADAIEINVPENSRLNADPSQSVGYATVGIGFTFAAACTESISRMYYISGLEEEVQASASGGLVAFIAAGLNRFGTFCANILFSNAVSFGGGGRIDSDGLINYHFYNPWQYISDFEADESVTNVMVLYSNRIPDSGGFGKHRAGPSNAQIAMFHKTPMALPTIVGTGSRITGNQGLYGGYPGHITKMVYLSNSNFYDLVKEGKPLPNEYEDVIDIRGKVSGDYQQFEASAPTIPMSAGTIVIYPQTTGGALGDPIERDPQLIIEDIRDGLATVEVSKKVYAVALDHETIEVDLDETKKRREARRKERISQGVPGKEYIKDLVEKRKNRELPQPALDLIDETINFSPAFKKQLEEEEKLLQKELKPIGKIKMKKLIFKLTPHVNVVEDENGNKVAMCSHCDFAYCDAREDYKLYSLIYDRAPSGVMPLHLAPDDDWATYREFYCPGCGSQTEVDQAPKGMPIIPNARIKGISY